MTETLKPAGQLAALGTTPFPGASPDYLEARRALLEAEIEFRRHMTRLTEQRRALPPGPVIARDYRFKDEQGFDAGLHDLFGDKDYGGPTHHTGADGRVVTFRRIALHAARVRFPYRDTTLVLEAEVPDDLASIWKCLGGLPEAWNTARRCAVP